MRKKTVKKIVKKPVKKSVQHSVTPVAPPKQVPFRTTQEKFKDGMSLLASKQTEGIRATLQNAADSMLILGYHREDYAAHAYQIYSEIMDLYEKIS